MINAEVQQQIDKLVKGEISSEAFSQWLDGQNEATYREVLNVYYERLSAEAPSHRMNAEQVDKLMAKIGAGNTASGKVVVMPVWRRVAAVAAVVMLVAVGMWLVNDRGVKENQTIAKTKYKGDVAPGKVGAVLRLDNGETIVLDTAGNGEVRDGFNKSNDVLAVSDADVEYASVETPKGRTMSVKLPDGTQVWLNADSKLRFPTKFKGNMREVEMEGECYFEVVHNDKQPFKVKVAGEVVEDIGTAFNINAYKDEAGMKTTLAEGAVKIQTFILNPGQQYQNGKVSVGDVEGALAWKNGLFAFAKSDIQTVMRSISRWYDVGVKYEGTIDETFTGKIGRDLTLAQVLDILKKTRVNFRIEEDKRVVIYP